MNCEEFEERLLQDPESRDARFLEHAGQCSRCRKSRHQALEFEARLRAAMKLPLTREVKVPPSPSSVRPCWWRLAAAAVMVIGAMPPAILDVGRPTEEAVQLPRLVAQHVQSEAELLSRTQPLAPSKYPPAKPGALVL